MGGESLPGAEQSFLGQVGGSNRTLDYGRKRNLSRPGWDIDAGIGSNTGDPNQLICPVNSSNIFRICNRGCAIGSKNVSGG